MKRTQYRKIPVLTSQIPVLTSQIPVFYQTRYWIFNTELETLVAGYPMSFFGRKYLHISVIDAFLWHVLYSPSRSSALPFCRSLMSVFGGPRPQLKALSNEMAPNPSIFLNRRQFLLLHERCNHRSDGTFQILSCNLR
jgi:hypothetical protein